MAIIEIPTGILPEEIVLELPETGEENKVYRRLVEDEALREMQVTEDFIWYDGAFHPFSFEAKIFGAYFVRYQESVAQTIANLEERIEALEDGKKLLFEGSDITLTEAGATRGEWIDITSDITVLEGTTFYVALQDMTIDGEPIEDYYGEGVASGVPGWDWQGSDFYDVNFGGGAYFAFGTEPKDSVATKVTLGFVNEGDGFPIRTLVIGHIKVEVV